MGSCVVSGKRFIKACIAFETKHFCVRFIAVHLQGFIQIFDIKWGLKLKLQCFKDSFISS